MRVLLYQYLQSLRAARKMLRPLKNKKVLTEREEMDKSLINSMIADLEYAIEWIKSGHNPDARRGIDKWGVYLTDPKVLDKLPVAETYKVAAKELSTLENDIIEDALCTLSKRERDVFMLVRVEGLSFEQAAELLDITKGAAQSYVERAEKKIEKRKSESLFLI
ncbi:sigma-70 family RNA polymerase sigma factor [Bacillus sp. Hm123]|uniref:sigma-70 family RNA polymerase sigma factor n=1 Tax=Bacillus sp. Hm123 TaxID=3450745 RepID=UPI003F4387CF